MQSHGPGGSLGKIILVVEDDPVNGLVLLDFLEHHGYRVYLSKTGPDGVAAFAKDRPDMVLVDVLLPRKNGFEVCFDIKRTERGRTTPVVLMSAIYKDVEHAEGYSRVDLGAAGFLKKPFELSELLTRVESLIGPALQS
ncbi:MAG TPA: response regulator [Polyangiaceae bacterium]|jgi:DNA-binding response OmpR family regulator